MATLPAVCGVVAISPGISIVWRCWPCFELWNTFSRTWGITMCWCAPTTHRWSLISTTKEVCARAPCTGWRARSLGGPKGDSTHWERYISLGISIWEQTSCRDRGRGPGNGCFTQMRWSKSGECLARLRWTSSLLRRQRNVPSGSL